MSHPPAAPANGRNKRPASIAELAQRAMEDLWDDTKDFKYYLRLAEKYRREGKECAKRGDLEGAFVELARAATLVLEKLPLHKDYNVVLNANQRHNLGLNGQDILENLGDLKPTLVERYDKWLQKQSEGSAEHERTPNARTQKIENDNAARAQAQRERFEAEERARQVSREQHRLAEEADRWKQQRADAETREHIERARRKEAATAAAHKAANIPRLPPAPDYTFSRTPMQNSGSYGSQNTVILSNPDDGNRQQEEMRQREEEIRKRQAEVKRRQEQDGIARRQQEADEAARMARQGLDATPSSINSSSSSMFPNHAGSSSIATTPSSGYYQPAQPIEYPTMHSNLRSTPNPPDRQNGFQRSAPFLMPLEGPSYEGESTDSESLHHFDARRIGKQRVVEHKTPTRNMRSPLYPPPITTTSPPPDAGSIRYPSLMSQHQKTQGYYPSLGSMFADSMGTNHGPSSMLFGANSNDSKTSSSLYSSMPTTAPMNAPHQYQPQSSHTSYNVRPPPPLPANAAPPQSAPPTQADMDRIIRASDPNLDGVKPLKTVSLPRECLPRFLAIAKVNTEMNRETCGLLLGKDKGHKFSVTTLLIPKQHSTSDTCTMDEEELVLQFTEERSLITLGWIHTHPSQSCFMSSVDLHTHSGFQRMLPESFAVVCAPKSNPNFGIFRLTDPPGLQAILGCTEKEAFHPHPDKPIYTDADKGHVQMKDSSLEIVDLR